MKDNVMTPSSKRDEFRDAPPAKVDKSAEPIIQANHNQVSSKKNRSSVSRTGCVRIETHSRSGALDFVALPRSPPQQEPNTPKALAKSSVRRYPRKRIPAGEPQSRSYESAHCMELSSAKDLETQASGHAAYIPQASHEFDRGPKASKCTRLFDPRKDEVPLIKKGPGLPLAATACPSRTTKHNVSQESASKKRKSSQHRKGQSIRKHTSVGAAARIAPLNDFRKERATDSSLGCDRLLDTGKLVVLRKPNSSKAAPNLVRQLSGETHDPLENLRHAEKLCAEIKAGLQTTKSMIDDLQCDGPPSMVQICQLVEAHRALLDAYYDFFLVTQHPQASEALRRLPVLYNITKTLWSRALHPVLEFLNAIRDLCSSDGPDLASEMYLSSIYYGYGLVCSLLICVPEMRSECFVNLAGLSALLATMSGELVFGSEWTDVFIMWQTRVVRSSPRCGQHYIELAKFCSEAGIIQKSFILTKARFAAIPELHAADCMLGDLYRSSIAPASCTDVHDSLEICFIRFHAIAHTQSAVCDFQNSAAVGSELIADPADGAMLAFMNVAAVHSFLTTVVVAATDIVEQTAALKIARDPGELVHVKLIEVIMAMLRRACGSEESGSLPHVFVWLVYINFAVQEPYWHLLEKALPWDCIAHCFQRAQDLFSTRHSSILQLLPLVLCDGSPKLLPEDAVLRGSMFADLIWPEKISTSEIDTDVELEDLSSFSENQIIAIRRERIVLQAVRLADQNHKLGAHMRSATPKSGQISASLGQDGFQRDLFPGYTILVFDSSTLLTDLGLLQDAVSAGFNIVIPLPAILQLDVLKRSQCDEGNISRASRSSSKDTTQSELATSITKIFIGLELSLKSRKVRVVLADGSNLRDLSFREEVDKDCPGSFAERIVAAAQHQVAHHVSERGGMKRNDDAEAAVLLSASFSVRMASFAVQVPAVSIPIVRAILKRLEYTKA